MFWYRLKHTIGMFLTRSSVKRAEYLKKHKIFERVGENCMVVFRKIPLYPKLISVGNNVWIASNVTFVTHDSIHCMLNNMKKGYNFKEHIGCIDIRDNVFVGANTTILSNVSIGPNVVIAAGSLVNRDISNGVYGGVPAKYICSMDEFVEKRKRDESNSGEEGFSDEIARQCWKRFREK